MPHLMQLRQQIKTTETMRKTTNAMRLIAMSTHTRLRNQKIYLDNYKVAVEQLARLVTYQTRRQSNTPAINDQELVILVGSQKGFCGNFNTALFTFFQQTFPVLTNTTQLITIGKQISDYVQQAKIHPKAEYNQFNAQNFLAIARELAAVIPAYSKVTVISTKAITFFTQYPIKTELHRTEYVNNTENVENISEYLWEQETEDIAHYLENLQRKVALEALLFEALLAEQAARFLSMDSATHNADTMIDTMKRDYNKMRQTTITLELLDFASSNIIS